MIRRHTWIWAAGCAVAVIVVVWLAYRLLAARGFDWALAAHTLAHLFFAFALSRVTAVHLQSGSKLLWVLALGGRVVAVASAAVLMIIVSMRHFAEPLLRVLLRAFRFLPERHFRKIEGLLTALV